MWLEIRLIATSSRDYIGTITCSARKMNLISFSGTLKSDIDSWTGLSRPLLCFKVLSQHSIRSDQTQLNAIDQSRPVESDRESDHSESGAVITLTIRSDWNSKNIGQFLSVRQFGTCSEFLRLSWVGSDRIWLCDHSKNCNRPQSLPS